MSTMGKRNSLKIMQNNFQTINRKSPGKPYIIQNGDTLCTISFKEYQHVKYWPYLWLHNLYPYHLYQATILSPLFIYPGSTIYLPTKKEIQELYDEEDETLLNRFRMSFPLSPIRSKPAYEMNALAHEKNIDVSTIKYSTADKNTEFLSHESKIPKENNKILTPKITIELGNLQLYTPKFSTPYGTVSMSCDISSGKLILQRPGNYPVTANFNINKRNFDLELKLETEGILQEFLKEIKLEFNGSLMSPKGEINFGLFKISIDKNGVPTFGKNFEHTIKGLKIKIDLGLAPPIGNVFIFEGSAYFEKQIGVCGYKGLEYEGTLEDIGVKLIVTYQNDGSNKNKLNMIQSLMRASELIREVQNGYRAIPKPGEKIFNVPKKPKRKPKAKRIPKGGVKIIAPRNASANVEIKAFIDEKYTENLNSLLRRKNRYSSNALNTNIIQSLLHEADTEMKMTYFSHVLDSVPFSFWYVNVFPLHKLYSTDKEDISFAIKDDNSSFNYYNLGYLLLIPVCIVVVVYAAPIAVAAAVVASSAIASTVTSAAAGLGAAAVGLLYVAVIN